MQKVLNDLADTGLRCEVILSFQSFGCTTKFTGPNAEVVADRFARKKEQLQRVSGFLQPFIVHADLEIYSSHRGLSPRFTNELVMCAFGQSSFASFMGEVPVPSSLDSDDEGCTNIDEIRVRYQNVN